MGVQIFKKKRRVTLPSEGEKLTETNLKYWVKSILEICNTKIQKMSQNFIFHCERGKLCTLVGWLVGIYDSVECSLWMQGNRVFKGNCMSDCKEDGTRLVCKDCEKRNFASTNGWKQRQSSQGSHRSQAFWNTEISSSFYSNKKNKNI